MFPDDARFVRICSPVLNRYPYLEVIIEKVSYFLSDSQIRLLLRMFPQKDVRHIMQISDTMRRRSQEIIEEKKAALREGNEALSHQVGEGKDLMSICREYWTPTLYRTGTDLQVSQSEHDCFPSREALR